jgi:galactokinase/mevalonate kinase-like predicted kinase
MSHPECTVASAPAAIAVAGDTCDISGKGGTLTLGIEGPTPTRDGGLRAFAMVAPGGGGATAIRVENQDEFTADTFFGAGRLLEMAGYAGSTGIAVTLNSLIPPRCGLGGSAAQLVALLCALDAFYGRQRPHEELAEIVQRATLRPGQVHGYQKPYGATYGGVRYFGFSRKLTGLWARGVGDIYDEPYALVSEARDAVWNALGARILIAVPKDLHLASGETNADIARRYREEDEATVKTMDRKTFVSQLAHQRLVNGDVRGFWHLVDTDTAIMEQWGLVGEQHRVLMTTAKEQGAYAAKPASTGGAVIVFYPESAEQPLLEALEEVAVRVYLARVAEGARQETEWPFGDRPADD